MTSLFDSATAIANVLRDAKLGIRSITSEQKTVLGIFLYALIDGLANDHKETRHKIIHDATREMLATVYEGDADAYAETKESELFDACLEIVKKIIERPLDATSEDEIDSICLLIEDGHDHDHMCRDRCAKYYWTGIIGYLAELCEKLFGAC